MSYCVCITFDMLTNGSVTLLPSIYVGSRQGFVSALFVKAVEASISLESLTAGSMMNKSSMVGSLMTDVSTVGPLGADNDSATSESTLSEFLFLRWS